MAAEPESIDWNALTPLRLREHRVLEEAGGESSLVSLLVPRLRSRWGLRLVAALRLRPYRVKLDVLGSFVWLHCDGKRTVGQLEELLAREFVSETQEKLSERLQLYLGQLARGGFLELQRPQPAGRAAEGEDG